jgi:hypothetical protein
VGIPVEAIIMLPVASLPVDHNSAEDNPISTDYRLPEGVAGDLGVVVGSGAVVAGIEAVVGSGAVVAGIEAVVGSGAVVAGIEAVVGSMEEGDSIIKGFMVAGLAGVIAMARELVTEHRITHHIITDGS